MSKAADISGPSFALRATEGVALLRRGYEWRGRLIGNFSFGIRVEVGALNGKL